MTNHHKISSSPLWLERLLFLLPLLVAFLAYLPALGNQFVWDDHDLLVNQQYLRDPALWADALRHLLAIISPNYFRPLAVLTFIAEARLWGLDPTFFHLTNITLHALNTLFVTLLARELWQPSNHPTNPPTILRLRSGQA